MLLCAKKKIFAGYFVFSTLQICLFYPLKQIIIQRWTVFFCPWICDDNGQPTVKHYLDLPHLLHIFHKKMRKVMKFKRNACLRKLANCISGYPFFLNKYKWQLGSFTKNYQRLIGLASAIYKKKTIFIPII